MRFELSSLKKVLLVFIIVCTTISFVSAIPTVPTAPERVTRLEDERFNPANYNAPTLSAEAGNVTRIEIYGLSQTQTWQGFYGEISGTITLDDAQNWTMYDWDMAEPQGEIYATPTTVSNWDTIHCLNYTAKPNWCVNLSANDTIDGWMINSFATDNVSLCNDIMNGTGTGNYTFVYNYSWDKGTKSTWTDKYLNLSLLENSTLPWSLGLYPNAYDGVDETFNQSGTITANYTGGENLWVNHSVFWAGTVEISEGSCPATDMYETVCMNKTNTDRKDQTPVFWYVANISGDTSYRGYTLCDLFLQQENYFDNNFSSLINLTVDGNNSYANDINLTNQVFKYASSQYGTNFQEVLLTVNNSQTVIYATMIENNQPNNRTDIMGFDNATHDFQMIVGDDGHPGPKQDTTTTYYFYVEIG